MFKKSVLLVGALLLAGPALDARQPAQQAQRPAAPPSIEDRTSGMKKMDGYFPLYWDERSGGMFLEIPRFDTEFLFSTGLSAGLGSNDIGLDRGSGRGGGRLVYFNRVGPRVMLVQPNQSFRSSSKNPLERKSVEDSFAKSILWGFTVAAESGGRVLVDATDFLLRDVANAAGSLRPGNYRLDRTRSAFYLPNTRNFPMNTEMDMTLTFVNEPTGGGELVDPELTVVSHARTLQPAGHGEEAPAPRPAPARAHQSAKQLLWASDVVLNPQYRFDNFVVGPCNRFAHAAALGVSEMPASAYNPFFLHGSVGLGKTHLLQSMCFALLERVPDTRILYLTCETFINHFIGALENGDLHKFRGKYRNVDVLVVDDIHMLANKDRTQEEFFHTFNTLYNAGKQIVLSSDSPPKEIPTLQERLVSRFKWGLVTEIEPPCYETRMAIIRRKSKQRGKELSEDVAQLLAENVANNVRELEGAVTRIIGFATLSAQEITPELVRKVLSDLFVRVGRGQPTMDDILKVVTGNFNVKTTDLQSRRRTNAIAYPRQVGMYLARRITRHSLEEIGGFFGGRDHSTVLYAIDKVERMQREDENFRALVGRLLDALQQG